MHQLPGRARVVCMGFLVLMCFATKAQGQCWNTEWHFSCCATFFSDSWNECPDCPIQCCPWDIEQDGEWDAIDRRDDEPGWLTEPPPEGTVICEYHPVFCFFNGVQFTCISAYGTLPVNCYDKVEPTGEYDCGI